MYPSTKSSGLIAYWHRFIIVVVIVIVVVVGVGGVRSYIITDLFTLACFNDIDTIDCNLLVILTEYLHFSFDNSVRNAFVCLLVLLQVFLISFQWMCYGELLLRKTHSFTPGYRVGTQAGTVPFHTSEIFSDGSTCTRIFTLKFSWKKKTKDIRI